MINVLLTSPDAAVRSSLARLLEAEPEVSVSEQTGSIAPDVVVMSLTHADEATEMRRRYPASRLLALLSVLRPDLRRADVDAWVDSVAPYDVLVKAIRNLGRRPQVV